MIVKGKFHRWMALALAIVAGALVFVLAVRWFGRSETPAAPPGVVTRPQGALEPAQLPANPSPAASAATIAALSAEELDHFRRNLRSAFLRAALDDMRLSPGGRASFIDGRLREALDANDGELSARAAGGDRDAAAALLRLRGNCRNPAWPNGLPLAADHPRDTVPAAGPRMPADLRTLILAAIDLTAEEVAAVTAYCRGTGGSDARELEAQVRLAADDGHAPSLRALAMNAPDDQTRERRLLSAAILGDVDAQLEVARLNARLAGADSAFRDRAKIRFWLEQANNRLPAATYELGRCLATGCDGRPAEPERARLLIETAARQGYSDAIDTLTAPGAADPGDVVERYAWLAFRARLARMGCYTEFADLALDEEHSGAALKRSLPAVVADQALAHADQIFKQYGAEAQAALACN
jgi:hypothetical protein